MGARRVSGVVTDVTSRPFEKQFPVDSRALNIGCNSLLAAGAPAGAQGAGTKGFRSLGLDLALGVLWCLDGKN